MSNNSVANLVRNLVKQGTTVGFSGIGLSLKSGSMTGSDD